MIFLSGVTNNKIEAALVEAGIGILMQPENSYHLRGFRYPVVGLDNACFGAGELAGTVPQVVMWKAWLREMGDWMFPSSVLFASVPDVIGDARRTLELFSRYGQAPRDLGFKSALVGQNGLEDLQIPWEGFDCLFLGGSTEWKLSRAAADIVQEAKARGKWVHMGRVNSGRRMVYAASIGCDSCDGTYLAFGPEVNLPRLLRMLAEVNGPAQLELQEVAR